VKINEKLVAAFLAESNEIEGYGYKPKDYLDTSTSSKKLTRSVVITNSLNAFSYLKENCGNAYTVGDICELHRLQMFGLLPTNETGQLRKCTIMISGYIPPNYEKLPYKLSQFCEKSTSRSLVGSMDLHFDFEAIHPFTDGNGRVGRLLWAWYLLRNGDGLHPFLDYFKGDNFLAKREHYYQSLNLHHQGYK